MKRNTLFSIAGLLLTAVAIAVVLTSFINNKNNTTAAAKKATALNFQTGLKVITGALENITATNAMSNFTVTPVGGQKVPVTKAGVLVRPFGSKANWWHYSAKNTGINYKAAITGLKAETKYELQPFAESGTETFYGNQIVFGTKIK